MWTSATLHLTGTLTVESDHVYEIAYKSGQVPSVAVVVEVRKSFVSRAASSMSILKLLLLSRGQYRKLGTLCWLLDVLEAGLLVLAARLLLPGFEPRHPRDCRRICTLVPYGHPSKHR